MDDDIHICGACREEFHSLDLFVDHKNKCPIRAAQKKRGSNFDVLQSPVVIKSAASESDTAGQVAFPISTVDVQFPVNSALQVFQDFTFFLQIYDYMYISF